MWEFDAPLGILGTVIVEKLDVPIEVILPIDGEANPLPIVQKLRKLVRSAEEAIRAIREAA
jgi:hypothetical protein